MLYTSYISNMKNLPQGKIILITRWAPKSLDLSKFDDATWEPMFGPSDMLLASYKNKTMKKSEMFESYYQYLKNNIFVNEKILEIVEEIKKGKDVFLVCYEKEICDCHRSVLAQYISQHHGISWQEYKK